MISTLIDEVDARLKAGIRAVARRKTVAAGIDVGTRSTQVALVGMHGDAPVVHSLVDERGGLPASAAALADERADIRASGIGGHEVRTFRMEFPQMPARELAVLVRRSVARDLRKDAVVAFEAAPGPAGKIDVLAAAAPAGRVSAAFAGLAEYGIEADAAYADVVALAECARAAYPGVADRAVCVFNMGATWSQLILLDRGRLVFSRSIKIGLDALSETISDLCDMPADEAEKLILSTGADFTFQDADEDDPVERAYAESVRDVMEQVVVEVHRSLSFASERHGLPSPDTILLCGGASLVPGMTSALGREMGTAVEIFDPLDGIARGDDVGPAVNGSLFCVALGLALLVLRPGSPAFAPPGRHEESGVENRVTTALVLAVAALATVFAAARAFDTAADRYARAVAAENAVLESVGERLAEGAGEAETAVETRTIAYSMLDEVSPVWPDVLREIGNCVPEGVVLEQLSFSRTSAPPGEFSEWTLAADGVVIDVNNTATLLTRMRENLETSDLFRDVDVLPQGSTASRHEGDMLAGAIRFELGAELE